MNKYSDHACIRCGKMMIHAYCSKHYCEECAKIMHRRNVKMKYHRKRTNRALDAIADVERAARAAGMSYGQYVALHEGRNS